MSGRDHSVRKPGQFQKTKEDIFKNESTFQALSESTAASIIVVQEQKIVYMNPAAEKLSGYTPGEINSISFLDLVHPEMKDFVKSRHIARLNREALPPCDEIKIITREGTIKWLNYAATLIRHNGKDAVLGSFFDITERKEAENRLKESEERYRNVVENMNVGMLVAQDLKLVFANTAISNFLGYPQEEIISKQNPFELIHPDDRDMVLNRHLQRINSEAPPETYPYRVITKSGEEKWVEVTGTRINWKGKPATLNFFTDISERVRFEEEKKTLQKQLLNSRKLEAVGTLASGISHNFRNIMTVILMNSQLLQMTYKEDSRLQEIVGVIQRYIDRGVQLVDELMNFSRDSSSKNFQYINLSEILREICSLAGNTFDKRFDIRSNIPETLPVTGDYAALSQVFMNLCTNARDAMPKGGRLNIHACREGNHVLVMIADTGEGMDKDTMDKCFDPFFTTKPVDKGTGLGLYTAYGTVKKHGGDIKVYSEKGRGTTFKLYFPLSSCTEKTKRPAPSHIKTRTGRKVLVVDDDIEICKSIAQLLEAYGYAAKYVTSAKTAIALYRNLQPDIVLLDRNMPEMDGITCAETITKFDENAKILMLSGYDEDGPCGITEAQKKLIKGYLTKPVNINRLLSQLMFVLN